MKDLSPPPSPGEERDALPTFDGNYPRDTPPDSATSIMENCNCEAVNNDDTNSQGIEEDSPPHPPSLSESSSSSSTSTMGGSIPRSDYGTVGRHLRRRPLHVANRKRRGSSGMGTGLGQTLRRLRMARRGSQRLRLTTLPVPTIPLRTPLLRRTSTSDSAASGNRSLRAATRGDHLRRLAYKRWIQSGLVWERLEQHHRASASAALSREVVPVDTENNDTLVFGEADEDTTTTTTNRESTVRGWDILFATPEEGSGPIEEVKEPEPSLESNEMFWSPFRATEASVQEKDLSPLSPGTAAESSATLESAVLSTETDLAPSKLVGIAKPKKLTRVSSLESTSSIPGKFVTMKARSSVSERGDEDNDETSLFEDCFVLDEEEGDDDDDDGDDELLEEIHRQVLREERTSFLSSNLQMIHHLLDEYADLYPSSKRKQQIRLANSREQNSLHTVRDNAYDALLEEFPVQVRLHNVSYQVQQPLFAKRNRIPTVYNTSLAYPIFKTLKRYRSEGLRAAWQQLWAKPTLEMVDILRDINLVLQPGRSYLVLGPPGSGKSSLLKAIAGRLRADIRLNSASSADDDSDFLGSRPSNGNLDAGVAAVDSCNLPCKPCTVLKGRIQYNGRTIPEGGKEFFIENAMVYIDQLDQHAPRLTVDETLEFAFQCKTGGNMFREKSPADSAMKKSMDRARENRLRVNIVLQALGLTNVRDTFVGDHSVRGISGGQRRRVTVGEMVMDRSPVLCGDEISTGLDAASTYDMLETLLYLGRLASMTRVIALLQPSPETVSLFDDVILLGEGRVLYAGPIEDVEGYFADLGYKSPEFMDVADFLQQVSTDDGAKLYKPSEEIRSIRPNAPTVQELADLFVGSSYGQRIKEELRQPHYLVWRSTDEGSTHGSRVSGITKTDTVTKKYANRVYRSTWLVAQRFLTLWKRDVRVIVAAAIKNILMGVSVGGVFSGIEDEISITGALFQAGLFIMLSAIQASSSMVTDRLIFYKHADANFYSAAPFVIGRTLSNLPQTVADVVLFGTILYYMIGLAGRDDTWNFLMFLSILIMFSLVMQQQLAVFAAVCSSSGLQVTSSIILLFLILFGGFIVSPEAIPHYWSWVYWWNPFAWAYRALIINEFRSARWDDPEATLERVGYDRESQQEWISISFLYLGSYFLGCCILTTLGLTYVRNTGGGRPDCDPSIRPDQDEVSSQPRITIPFKPVDLTFKDICYDVVTSKGKTTVRLLNNVNGIFRAGRMCALMGSSGAGKSTLMDVIAGRKSSGRVFGEVRLNGFVRDDLSFRRASGYVEQFDVQSPELTVHETVLFSARLRIDRDVLDNEEQIQEYVDAVLRDVELLDLKDALVGDDDGSGLSFEQKKRLSIAVELAASPSIIFLDEPTSGLDARSALLIVRTLRNIANAGRTICATIHQPSSTVFDMFDDLLLLKKGGEVVYHGSTGKQSIKVVEYFEALGAPRIELGENPANWMLRVVGNEKLGDLAQHFRMSSLFRSTKDKLESISQADLDLSKKIEYDHQFATSKQYRQSMVSSRLRLIYWRSPAYNRLRMLVSGTVAFILGSLFMWARFDEDFREADIRARLSVVFLSFIITGMLAIFGSIPVMTKLRDMFYRHRISGMYGSSSIGLALGSAEKPFILLSTTIFTIVFLSTAALMDEGVRFFRGVIAFWGFFTFNFAIYSYFGQAFVCLVKPTATALILSSVFIGLNNFFSGLIVRPQYMVGTFFAVPYYICPGHYVYEGLVTSLYTEDGRVVYADTGSEFWQYLVNKEGGCSGEDDEICIGSVAEYVSVFFGNEFTIDHVLRNGMILGFVLILTRGLTYVSLKYIRFSQ